MRWKRAEDVEGDVFPAPKPIVGEDTSRQCPRDEKTISIIKEKTSKKSSSRVLKKIILESLKENRKIYCHSLS